MLSGPERSLVIKKRIEKYKKERFGRHDLVVKKCENNEN